MLRGYFLKTKGEKQLAASLIQNYICKRLLFKVSLTLIISSGLFFIVFIMLWSPAMITNGWNEFQICLFMLYKILPFLGDTYPAAIGIGTLMTFSSLAQSNELVILRAFGFSKIDFIRIILPFVTMLALFGFFLIAYFGPVGYNLSAKIKINSTVFQSAWIKQKNSIIYIKKIGKRKLYDITILNLKNTGIKNLYTVKKVIAGNSSQLYAILVKNYNHDSVAQEFIRKLTVPDFFPRANFLRLLQESEKRLTILQLYHIIRIQKKMGLNSRIYQFQFYQMILLPFFTVILMFMVMPFAFKENRSNDSMKNIILGLMIGLVFYFFDQISFPLVVILKFPMFLGALIAPISIFIFCLGYLCFT